MDTANMIIVFGLLILMVIGLNGIIPNKAKSLREIPAQVWIFIVVAFLMGMANHAQYNIHLEQKAAIRNYSIIYERALINNQ